MLDKVKSFFKTKEKEDSNDSKSDEPEKSKSDNLGSITYYFKSSDDDTYLDIQLGDFEEDTLNKFAKIVSGLSSIRFQLETLQMIKGCFEESGDEDIFNEIVAKMIRYTEEEAYQVEQINKESKVREDQPWIKPSDMIN